MNQDSALRVAQLYLRKASLEDLPAGLQEEADRVVSSQVSKYLREMKTAYRRMYNAQKYGGKVFEDLVAAVVPNYDPDRGDFFPNLDPEWVPYVGRVDFDREQLPDVKKAVLRAFQKALSDLFGEPLGMSSEFRWDTETDEKFRFLNRWYDVRAAKQFLVRRPRVVEALSLDGIKGLAARALGMNPETDTVDVRLPVLVVLTPQGNLLPIDGWNRIRKALASGLSEVPAVFLNASESKRVTLDVG